MIKVAIVEDEKLLLEDIEESVDWESIGAEVAFTERNGVNALKHIQKEPVDIVITDIRMPVMSGIELVEKLRESRMEIQIIFLTGYEEVEYMKSAIRLGAVSFLSKPFREEELQAAVQTAVKKIEMHNNAVLGEQMRYENELKEIILSGKKDSRLLNQGRYTLILARINCFLAMFHSRSATEVNWMIDRVKDKLMDFFSCRAEKFIILHLSKGQFLIAVREPFTYTSITVSDLEELSGDSESLKISLFVPKDLAVVQVEQFRAVYDELMDLVQESFYTGRNFRQAEERADIYKKALCKELFMLSEYDFTHKLRFYMDAAVSQKINRSKVMNDCYEICCAIYDTFADSFKDQEILKLEKHNLILSLEEFDTVGEIERFIWDFYQIQKKCARQPEEVQDDEQIVLRILHYIDEHYAEPISAETLVDEFYFASNTIRSLFKKHTDQTIHEYLSQVRMEKATQMLKNPKLKIKKIASGVGYDNVSYFCKIFSKDYGMSPLAYRKKYLNVIGGIQGEKTMEETELI